MSVPTLPLLYSLSPVCTQWLHLGKRKLLCSVLRNKLISKQGQKQEANKLIYNLTTHSWVLFQEMTIPQLVKKFTTLYQIQSFSTVFKTAKHSFLSWARLIQSMSSQPFFFLRSILIWSFQLCLGLPSDLFPSGFPTKTLYAHPFFPHKTHALPISYSWFYQISGEEQI